ncbi:hypothetical protein [Henriciella barbarensis]|nr:hypothetical protein [Henriciella barbarensis]
MTRLQAGPRLIEASEAVGLQLNDIGYESALPIIELKGPKIGARRETLPLPKSARVDAYLRQLAELQAHLNSAKLTEAGSGNFRIHTSCRVVSRSFLDGSLERGGRLNGSAFWLCLPKEQRRANLRISGEPIAEVDIRAAVPAIAYAYVGQSPDGDPYALPQAPDIPRDAVKKVMMQMFWSEISSRSRLPDEARLMIPDAYTAKHVYSRIRERNAPIASLLGRSDPLGAKLMWFESEIIMEATLRCYTAGIHALPLHDALLVPASAAEHAKEILQAAFVDRMRKTPEVTIERF